MNTAHTRRHWSIGHRERKDWGIYINFSFPARVRPKKPLKKARVTFTRICCPSRPPDPDNIIFSSKPALDALVKIGFFVDDGFDIQRVPAWRKGKRGESATEILIEEIE
jgi:Holliday junction resolvase RusA-like endonuclease